MDDRKFDSITQALAADGSRRRVLGALVGGVAALAGVATLEAKRGGNGKGRGRGRRNNGTGGNGNGGNGNGGGGRGQEKVTLCHRNNGRKGFNLITVGAPAVPAHERHGDVVCDELPCQVAIGCALDAETEEPECVFEPAEAGTGCVTEDGVDGTCDNGGTCVPDEDDDGTAG